MDSADRKRSEPLHEEVRFIGVIRDIDGWKRVAYMGRHRPIFIIPVGNHGELGYYPPDRSPNLDGKSLKASGCDRISECM